MKTIINFTSALLIITFLSSCSNSVSEQAKTPTVHELKQGDTFSYHEHQTDTLGAEIAGTDTIRIASVNRILPEYFGMNAVAEIIKGSDTTYFAGSADSSFYTLQNAIAIGGAQMPMMWVYFDYSNTGKTLIDSTMNTTINGTSAKVHIEIGLTDYGKENLNVGTTSLTSYRFTKSVKVTVTVFGLDYITNVLVTYSYAPSIGYLTVHNSKTTSNSNQSPYPDGISYSELVSYSIK
jgi:hypothetical protein